MPTRSRRRADIFGFISAVLPIVYIIFAISDHYDFWDGPRGLNAVKKVAAQMETSYDPKIKRQFRPGEDGFKETLALIRKYSAAVLPQEREPVVIARYVAVASSKIDAGDKILAEWTAGTTPLVILYQEPPAATLKDGSALFVGSIGDLRVWIERSKKDFHFLVQDVAFALVSIVLGILVWSRRRDIGAR